MSSSLSQKQQSAGNVFNPLPPSPPSSFELPAPPPYTESTATATSQRTPRIERLIRSLRDIHSGRKYQDLWIPFQLTATEFAQLHREFLAPRADCDRKDDFHSWCSSKLRWDWDIEEDAEEDSEQDTEEGEFVVRMPSTIHDRFIIEVRERVKEQIAQVAKQWKKDPKNKKAALLLDGIREAGSARIKFRFAQDPQTLQKDPSGAQRSGSVCAEQQRDKHELSISEDEPTSSESPPPPSKEPDVAFSHTKRKKFPPLIVEVARSQSQKDLRKVAESFIIASHNYVRTVVGFKLPYETPEEGSTKTEPSKEKDHCAYLSIWRAFVDEDRLADMRCDRDEIPFQDTSGESLSGNLVLLVKDFMPPAVLDEEDPTSLNFLHDSQRDAALVRIPFDDLTAMLRHAEQEQADNEQPPDPFPKGLIGKKRKQRSSPDAEWNGRSDPSERTKDTGRRISERVKRRKSSEG
ncbi:Hypothetical predicted protein [Lecanosticta acicola]|uniref:Uncharacterized protein n=1 Tax=Lecanosticta acicola TaxID=111012 RepID=A0AAI8Z290_9PEZI|nr:Hypothetical predicted protein [Lecanosticta acicola]